LRRLRVDEAAHLTALAEKLRGELLRGEMTGRSFDDLDRLERKAAAAVKALGLQDTKPKPADSMLVDYFTRGK
jgi:hypothetical protein